jgi:hypothetical protein
MVPCWFGYTLSMSRRVIIAFAIAQCTLAGCGTAQPPQDAVSEGSKSQPLADVLTLPPTEPSSTSCKRSWTAVPHGIGDPAKSLFFVGRPSGSIDILDVATGREASVAPMADIPIAIWHDQLVAAKVIGTLGDSVQILLIRMLDHPTVTAMSAAVSLTGLRQAVRAATLAASIQQTGDRLLWSGTTGAVQPSGAQKALDAERPRRSKFLIAINLAGERGPELAALRPTRDSVTTRSVPLGVAYRRFGEWSTDAWSGDGFVAKLVRSAASNSRIALQITSLGGARSSTVELPFGENAEPILTGDGCYLVARMNPGSRDSSTLTWVVVSTTTGETTGRLQAPIIVDAGVIGRFLIAHTVDLPRSSQASSGGTPLLVSFDLVTGRMLWSRPLPGGTRLALPP